MPLMAGFGCAELTPPLGVELAGYGYYLNRVARRVRDPLYARALLVTDGDRKALIVSCDVLGLSREIADQVKRDAKKLGISEDQITLVSIHTHTGPAIIYHLGCGEVSPDYVRTVDSRISSAVSEACRDLAPVAALKTCVHAIDPVYAYNRAIPDAPVDQNVRGAYLARIGAPDIAIVSFACHGVSLGRADCISADYSGEVHRIFRSRGVRSIYVNGVCGDIDPIAPDGFEEREKKMAQFGQAIVSAFDEGLHDAFGTLASGTIPFSLHLMTLPEDQVHQVAQDAVARYGGEDLPQARVAQIWEKQILSRPSQPTHEDILVPYVRLGDLTVLALPFEGFTKTGMIIREAAGSKVIVLGCMEQILGYLPIREDIERASYAALESAFLYQRMPPLPGEAERLGEEIGRAIGKE